MLDVRLDTLTLMESLRSLWSLVGCAKFDIDMLGIMGRIL